MTTKRDQILTAALALFAEKGFHGTAMPELAKHAGVGTGTIYRHFENKETLVNALYQHWKGELSQALYVDLSIEGSWRSRFRDLWHQMFAFAMAHPQAIAFLDMHHHGDYLDATSREVEAQSAAGFAALVIAGQADEAFVDLPPGALIGLFWGGFLGLLRAEAGGFLTLDEATINATEERAWALIRR